jgi:AmmeMemoRadiSam system protein B
MMRVRPPAVAGMFYPRQPAELSREVRNLLHEAAFPPEPVPKAIIAPHAGYVYSGAIAASAYVRFLPARGRITRVVVLGPAHRVLVDGLALPGADGLATPLGVVPVDLPSIPLISRLEQVVESPAAHELEHSIEVHLPFLQTVLEKFTVLPLVVGDVTPEEVAEVLDALWGGEETLIVVSSDLSHYLTYDRAKALDRATADAIVALRGPIGHEQACGGTPVSGLLVCARRHNLNCRLLDLRNSGDTAGDRSRVVGYGAFEFSPSSAAVH